MGYVSGSKRIVDSNEKCPDVTKVLAQLKDFQLKSVNKIFQRLYIDKDKTNRFLLADEVGLGKTLVARGVIAKSIEYLWDKVERIDVIYVCSNREIAKQNINRLNITGDKQFSLASRLTLLPLKISNLKGRRLNFISFTPGTSFDLHSHAGIMQERALLYHILKKGWNLKGIAGPINLFQHWASRTSWRGLINNFHDYYDIDDDLAGEFIKALDIRIQTEKAAGKIDIKSRFIELSERFSFHKKRENISSKDWRDRANFISDLRIILAQSCLEALEPDLVILDEFQRFKYLLDSKNEMCQLANHLFEYKNKEMPTKMILLSATPYKMYTMHNEEEADNHYEDFIRTIKFLKSPKGIEGFEEKLKCFRNELFSVNGKNFDRLRSIKIEIENELRKIMIRTEKLAHTKDRDGMIKEVQSDFCKVNLEDIKHFSFLDKISQSLKSYDIIEFWKSSPYLLNLMDEYKFKRRFIEETEKDNPDQNIVKLLQKNKEKLLKWETIQAFKKITPVNAKLRTLLENGINKGSWQLLWIPPSLPYYKPDGVYENKILQNYTKSLIFSSWQIVPKAISMLCSYAAERQMVSGYKEAKNDYREERKSRRPLLVFRQQEGKLQGMASLSLLYPCITLANKIDPLAIAIRIMPRNGYPSSGRMKYQIKSRIKDLLDEACGGLKKRGGRPDKRWYWAALAMLDKHFYGNEVKEWLNTDKKEIDWSNLIKARGDSESDTFFSDHVKRLKQFFNNSEELGPRPKDLLDILTKFALASPSVVALRSLLRLSDDGTTNGFSSFLYSASLIGAGFRILYNLPDSITLIRSLYDNEREPYWEKVLNYGISGSLQAVLDEYVHVLKESLGLIDKSDDEAAESIAKEIYTAITIRTISLDFEDIVIPPSNRKILLERHSIRCRYALRLAEAKNYEDKDVTRSDQVRIAFNSPFRPFLLATTSIGQEGLDFHQYCRSIYHWNLPSNPVDFEQREGRIHRYKGLVIRTNLIKHYGLKKLKQNMTEKDPWEFLFQQAVSDRKSRNSEKDDIEPFWVFETDNGEKIERHIPSLPLSRDNERLRDLKRTLVMYRMVFGQPRQEDLIEFLNKIVDEEGIREEVENFRIDLSPE